MTVVLLFPQRKNALSLLINVGLGIDYSLINQSIRQQCRLKVRLRQKLQKIKVSGHSVWKAFFKDYLGHAVRNMEKRTNSENVLCFSKEYLSCKSKGLIDLPE